MKSDKSDKLDDSIELGSGSTDEASEYSRGITLLKEFNISEARDVFEKILEKNPESAQGHFGLGCVYLRLGMKDRAVEAWEKCVEYDPSYVDGHYALSWACYDSGDFVEGYQYLNRALESGKPLDSAKELFDILLDREEPSKVDEKGVKEVNEKPADEIEKPEEILKDVAADVKKVEFIDASAEQETREEKENVIERLYARMGVEKHVIYDVICIFIIVVVCFTLLKGTLREGYPSDYLDATMAFYFAKVKTLLQDFMFYTESWYFGFELLRFYPPLSTILPYILARLSGNALFSYYLLCFVFYTLFCLGIYFFLKNYLKSRVAGLTAGILWSITHVYIISFQGHYWETARLMGTAIVPWVLYFTNKTIENKERKYLLFTVALSSYIFLSSMLSVFDLVFMLTLFILIRGYLIPYEPRERIPEIRNETITYATIGIIGIAGFCLWWYVPAIFPHGLSTYLSGSAGNPPGVLNILFQLNPPSWMPAVQLPITLLGFFGAITALYRQERKGMMLFAWLLFSIITVYVIGIQPVRLILNIGLSLILLSGYFMKELESLIKYIFSTRLIQYQSRANITYYLLVSLIVLILSLSAYSRYNKLLVVNDDYLSSDEYLTASWLKENLDPSDRVYTMYGEKFRGSQWINTYYPEIKQVLGGFDQGGRVGGNEPFEIDYAMKNGQNDTEIFLLSKEYQIKYLVIDKDWMQKNSAEAYEKFVESSYFTKVLSINDKLTYAEVFEVLGIENGSINGLEYNYWNTYRILGIGFSTITLAAFIFIFKKYYKKKEVWKNPSPTMINLEFLKKDNFLNILTFSSLTAITVYIVWSSGGLSEFPKGVDAYAHLYKIKYILNNFPHYNWNYQWNSGVPLFGGFYPPLGYIISAATVIISGLSIEAVYNILSILSVCINTACSYAFLFNITGNRKLSFSGVLLFLFSPAYWEYWLDGGNFGRVLSMGFIGISLFLVSIIFTKKKDNKWLKFLFVIILSFSISIHLLGGLISIFVVFTYILFQSNDIKNNLITIFKIMVFIVILNSFFISQYIFSNPTAGGIGTRALYNPAPFIYLLSNSSILCINILITPLILILLFSFIFLKNEIKIKLFEDRNDLRAAFVITFASSLLPMIYSFIGYLPGYPKNLYIDGFPPEYTFGISSYFLGLFIIIFIYTLLRRYDTSELIRFSSISLIVLNIAVGVFIELPVIWTDTRKRAAINAEHFSLMEVISVDPNNLDQRFGNAYQHFALWFNYLFDVPQTRDYYAHGVPYPDWYAWQVTGIWETLDNIGETKFLLDWYAVKWILTKDSVEKFQDSDDFRIIESTNEWFEFQYEEASSILSATNSAAFLFIGSDVHYDVFLRVLGKAGITTDEAIPVKGHSMNVDDYSLDVLELFDGLILYGYDYNEFEVFSNIVDEYVRSGGYVFIESNGSPDDRTETLPAFFPISDTSPSVVEGEWNFRIVEHGITNSINFSGFSPPRYDDIGWGVITTGSVKEGASVLVSSSDLPLMATGSVEEGHVFWSGMNIFYHAKSFENLEECELIRNILLYRKNAQLEHSNSYSVEFLNPENRIINLNESAKGILFKESFFTQWRATMEIGNLSEDVNIYLAGPGLMYAPLNKSDTQFAKIVFTFEITIQEKIGYLLTIMGFLILAMYTWNKGPPFHVT